MDDLLEGIILRNIFSPGVQPTKYTKRAVAEIKKVFLDLIGEDDKQVHGKDIKDSKYPDAQIRNRLRAELRSKIQDK